MGLITTLVSICFLVCSSAKNIYFHLPGLGEGVTRSNAKEDPTGHAGAAQNNPNDSDNGVHNHAKGKIWGNFPIGGWIRNNSQSSQVQKMG